MQDFFTNRSRLGLATMSLKSMLLIRALLCITCLGLAGCIAGYYAPAPKEARGYFVVNSKGAVLEPCDLGPGLSSGNTPATCIYPGPRTCNSCVFLSPGTLIKVLNVWVGPNGGPSLDFSIKVGTDTNRKVVHAYRNWDQMKQALVRPQADVIEQQ